MRCGSRDSLSERPSGFCAEVAVERTGTADRVVGEVGMNWSSLPPMINGGDCRCRPATALRYLRSRCGERVLRLVVLVGVEQPVVVVVTPQSAQT
jgi:hypothetical protein